MSSSLRQSCRSLLRNRTSTWIGILSLSIGIGISTTIFSLVDGLMLRPPGVAEPASLVTVKGRAEAGRETGVSYPDWLDLQRTTHAFAGLAVSSGRGSMLQEGGEQRLLLTQVVSENYFEVLGVTPALGRFFRVHPQEDTASIVLSHHLWQTRFGADPHIVGRQIRLSNTLQTVIGVAPASFHGMEAGIINDLWISRSGWTAMGDNANDFTARGYRFYDAVGRLRAGSTLRQAGTELAAAAATLASAYPQTEPAKSFEARPLMRSWDDPTLRPAYFLLAMAVLVLLIACSNAAGLAMASSEARRGELALRQALGASRTVLLRHLLMESGVVTVAAFCGGMALLFGLMRASTTLLPPSEFAVEFGMRPDLRVLAFALSATLVTALLFALLPALRASRVNLTSQIRREGPAPRRRRWNLRDGIVVAQVALAVVLLYSCATLYSSYRFSRNSVAGLTESRNMVSFLLAQNGKAEPDSAYRELAAQVQAVPGVRRVTYARRLPMGESGGGATVMVEFPGLTLPPGQARLGLHFNQTGPDYFAITGTPILRGRAFAGTDTAQSEKVAIVSSTLAERFWGGSGAALRHWMTVDGVNCRVVGVAGNVPSNSVHEKPEPYVYLPFSQKPTNEATLIVETAAAPGPVVPSIRPLLRESALNPTILVTTTLRDHMRQALYDDWLNAVLSSGVSMLGMGLAGIGLFGVLFASALRRVREFGIRMALGARPFSLFALVVRQGAALVLAGIMVGLPLALETAHLMRSMIYGVAAVNGAGVIASLAALALLALVAALLPALRAMGVDPSITLREQ